MIRVTLRFAPFFSHMLGMESLDVALPGKATVGDAIGTFLEEHPDFREILEKRNTFLFEELRAIYTVDGKAVLLPYVLKDGDELKVLKAFIGG